LFLFRVILSISVFKKIPVMVFRLQPYRYCISCKNCFFEGIEVIQVSKKSTYCSIRNITPVPVDCKYGLKNLNCFYEMPCFNISTYRYMPNIVIGAGDASDFRPGLQNLALLVRQRSFFLYQFALNCRFGPRKLKYLYLWK
jgi:hypothetical protein